MAIPKVPQKTAADSVGDFLKQELSTTLEGFTNVNKPWVLKRDLLVTLLVMHGPHYPVYETTRVKKGAAIRVIGPNHTWQPMGYTNNIKIELFEKWIELRPLGCSLEKLVEALK